MLIIQKNRMFKSLAKLWRYSLTVMAVSLSYVHMAMGCATVTTIEDTNPNVTIHLKSSASQSNVRTLFSITQNVDFSKCTITSNWLRIDSFIYGSQFSFSSTGRVFTATKNEAWCRDFSTGCSGTTENGLGVIYEVGNSACAHTGARSHMTKDSGKLIIKNVCGSLRVKTTYYRNRWAPGAGVTNFSIKAPDFLTFKDEGSGAVYFTLSGNYAANFTYSNPTCSINVSPATVSLPAITTEDINKVTTDGQAVGSKTPFTFAITGCNTSQHTFAKVLRWTYANPSNDKTSMLDKNNKKLGVRLRIETDTSVLDTKNNPLGTTVKSGVAYQAALSGATPTVVGHKIGFVRDTSSPGTIGQFDAAATFDLFYK
jgi:hypothetical protein